MLTDRLIEPGEVAERMAKELGDNARQKALQVLKSVMRLATTQILRAAKKGRDVFHSQD